MTYIWVPHIFDTKIMKTKVIICAFCAIAAVSASAANYVFHGNVSGDLLDAANWYEVSGRPDIWNFPQNKEGTWTFSQASSVPTAGDVSSIGRYYYGSDTQNLMNAPVDLYVGSSASIGRILFSEARNSTIWLGSEGRGGEDFELSMDYYGSGSYWKVNNNIYIDSSASQKSFSVKVSGEVYLTQDSHNWGSIQTGALDRIELGGLGLAFQNVYFNTYARSYRISGNVKLNASTDGYNDTAPANVWTVFVPQNALSEDSPLIQIDGALSRADNFQMLSKIVFDFNWDYEDFAPGEYVLISAAGGVLGFDDGGIEIQGIDETYWQVAWKGNDLVLSSVPEPAVAAFSAGVLALAAVLLCRRK